MKVCQEHYIRLQGKWLQDLHALGHFFLHWPLDLVLGLFLAFGTAANVTTDSAGLTHWGSCASMGSSEGTETWWEDLPSDWSADEWVWRYPELTHILRAIHCPQNYEMKKMFLFWFLSFWGVFFMQKWLSGLLLTGTANFQRIGVQLNEQHWWTHMSFCCWKSENNNNNIDLWVKQQWHQV
jgi:hypothetical protein